MTKKNRKKSNIIKKKISIRQQTHSPNLPYSNTFGIRLLLLMNKPAVLGCGSWQLAAGHNRGHLADSYSCLLSRVLGHACLAQLFYQNFKGRPPCGKDMAVKHLYSYIFFITSEKKNISTSKKRRV